MKRHTIVGIGEILWDVFPDCSRFGGAPANFACSAAGLGRERVGVHMVSSVGTDDLGTRAVAALGHRSVGTSYVESQDKPTGQVRVELDEMGRANYEFASDTAWDNLIWSDDLAELARRTDACCFGTLGQRSERSCATIQKFVSSTASSKLRVFDVNLRPPFVSDAVLLDSLRLANVLKLNDEELPVVAELCGLSGTNQDVMRQLAERFELRAVALTRGAEGAVLLRGSQVSEHAGVKTNVVDTVGAGDAFTAALSLGLLDRSNLQEINEAACSAAAFVCSQSGATPHMSPLNDYSRCMKT
ncbi:carbohydrate kinase family protein [Bythopirellula goksoeyrii]|uniref:Fructosamine kinase FrlD n=1 Tax=Bythopirellula goksoeyrii TaxID=1400387 RepID=A0A5B9QIF1_9BACT|nr:carbohydrate kinase [Bythopirellula goksoeyrii]QEG37370.1 Fructosamine kinase FrlD [Bythopirellula goksoeyrii]